jgi:hypothetical protein
MRASKSLLSASLVLFLSSSAWAFDVPNCSAGSKPEYKDTNFSFGKISREWRAVITVPTIHEHGTPDPAASSTKQCKQYRFIFASAQNAYTTASIKPEPLAGVPDCDNGSDGGPGWAGRIDVFCVQDGTPDNRRHATISFWNDLKAKTPNKQPYRATYVALGGGTPQHGEMIFIGYGAGSENGIGVEIRLIPLASK